MQSELDILTGSTERHLSRELEVPLHSGAIAAVRALKVAASDAGFELRIASGFRSFERQLLIWNDKLAGRRPVLDDNGYTLDLAQLDDWSQVQAVLRWSALPGASRHHWGTDFDVYDAAAVAPGYQLQLSAEEAAPGGPFAALHEWLDEYLQQQDDFFRPYAADAGGIAPERWHLSYAPLAAGYQRQLSIDCLAGLYNDAAMAKAQLVRERLAEIYRRYIHVSPLAYPERFRAAVV